MNHKFIATQLSPFSCKESMMSLDHFKSVYQNIFSRIKVTPLNKIVLPETGRDLFLKREDLQATGSFKLRGALNFILSLSDEARRRGVVARSSGNFGQGLAFAGQLTGCPVTVVMPENGSMYKQTLIEQYGGGVVRYKGNSTQGDLMVDSIVAQTGKVKAFSSDHPDVIAGQGTIGFEILDQHPSVDMVFCPISGGGLISGVGALLKQKNPAIKLIGVEPIGANRYSLSLASGKPVSIDVADTIADGLRTVTPGIHAWPLIQQYVDDVITVTDDQIRDAMRRIELTTGSKVEPSGAVSVAGCMGFDSSQLGKSPVCVITGGNITENEYRALTLM